MTAGVAAVILAVVVALVAGGVWRRTNGRMRAPRRSAPARMTSAPVSTVAAAAVLASSGPVTAVPMTTEAADPEMRPDAADTGIALTSGQLGQALGERATLVQFSSAFCAPCRATRRILADVAGMTPGVAHIEIDAESHLDLVRELNVLRTPTVLVLAADGRVVRRASGQPRKPDVIAAIGAAAGT
jgi:thiol-disulfide isomerase/thioredoxin